MHDAQHIEQDRILFEMLNNIHPIRVDMLLLFIA